MAYIGNKPAEKYATFSKQSITPDGSTTTFTLDHSVANENELEVFVDNVRQEPGSGKAYTASGTTLTMSEAVGSASAFYVLFQGKATQTVTPGDGTVTDTHLAGSITNAKLANSNITINGTSIALGASGTIVAGTDWQTVVTADGSTATTAVAGEGYFIDTTSNTHTVTLPASPTQGDEVHIVDYAGTFGTNNVTIGRNGSNIDNTATNGLLSVNRQNVRFVYMDSTQGWRSIFDGASTSFGSLYVTATGGTVTTSGDYKIHTFTGDGCFVVSCAGNSAGSNKVSYVVVAGGGSGGAGCTGGGGGGAGGYREGKCTSDPYSASPLNAPDGITATATTYPITVGGGASGVGPAAAGASGSNSIFSTITSAGGGGGGRWPVGGQSTGGSGGGSAQSGCAAGAAGNTPPVSPPQGNKGGNRGHYQMAGGGGATAEGFIGNVCGSPATRTATEGNGGTGATSSINGTPTERAGGGAGGYASGSPTPNGKATATGGGGSGGGQGSDATAGTANTGGGGGGNGSPSSANSGAGGSGVVILRYKYQN